MLFMNVNYKILFNVASSSFTFMQLYKCYDYISECSDNTCPTGVLSHRCAHLSHRYVTLVVCPTGVSHLSHMCAKPVPHVCHFCPTGVLYLYLSHRCLTPVPQVCYTYTCPTCVLFLSHMCACPIGDYTCYTYTCPICDYTCYTYACPTGVLYLLYWLSHRCAILVPQVCYTCYTYTCPIGV